MKRTSLETAEKAIKVALSASSCMGFTLFGWFILKLILPAVTEDHMWNCFLVSVVLTYVLQRLLTFVGMKITDIKLEEMEILI